MTGGMAYEALNNLGHSAERVIIVLNDNGRSYAPTISNLTAERPRPETPPTADTPPVISRIGEWMTQALTEIRLNPVYVRRQRKLEELVRDVPLRRQRRPSGRSRRSRRRCASSSSRRRSSRPSASATSARSTATTSRQLEPALRNAVELSSEGPIVVHVLTQKGKGYPPAEDDDEKHLHDAAGVRPAGRPAQGGADRVHAGLRRGDHQGGRGRPDASSPSPRRWRARPACCPSRTASPSGSSTSASPSSTPSPPRPAWRWAGCARSWRSTRRSCRGPGTRWCTTSPCTGCR